jgi:hypothetical protein
MYSSLFKFCFGFRGSGGLESKLKLHSSRTDAVSSFCQHQSIGAHWCFEILAEAIIEPFPFSKFRIAAFRGPSCQRINLHGKKCVAAERISSPLRFGANIPPFAKMLTFAIGAWIKVGYRCFDPHYRSHFEQLLLMAFLTTQSEIQAKEIARV